MFKHKAAITILTLLLSLIALAPLASAALADPRPTVTGAQGVGAKAPHAPQANYPLNGDDTNTGTAQTYFYTSYGDTQCDWCFLSTSTMTGTVALIGDAGLSAPQGVGVRGWGIGGGV